MPSDFSARRLLRKIVIFIAKAIAIPLSFKRIAIFLSPLPKILEVSKYKKKMSSKSIKTF